MLIVIRFRIYVMLILRIDNERTEQIVNTMSLSPVNNDIWYCGSCGLVDVDSAINDCHSIV